MPFFRETKVGCFISVGVGAVVSAMAALGLPRWVWWVVLAGGAILTLRGFILLIKPAPSDKVEQAPSVTHNHYYYVNNYYVTPAQEVGAVVASGDVKVEQTCSEQGR
jgi:hypothetical protein